MSVLIGFRFIGLTELLWDVGDAPRKINEEITKRMKVLVLEVAGEAQRHISGTRAGNPPELLGIISGRLRAAITGKVRMPSSGITEGVISPQGVKYAAIQEFGGTIHGRPFLTFKTPDGSWHRVRQVTIPARPYLRAALRAKEDRITELLGGAFAASVTRS